MNMNKMIQIEKDFVCTRNECNYQLIDFNEFQQQHMSHGMDVKQLKIYKDSIQEKLSKILEILVIGQEFEQFKMINDDQKYMSDLIHRQEYIRKIMNFDIDGAKQKSNPMELKMQVLEKENKELKMVVQGLNEKIEMLMINTNIIDMLRLGQVSLEQFKKYHEIKKQSRNHFHQEMSACLDMDFIKFQQNENNSDIVCFIICDLLNLQHFTYKTHSPKGELIKQDTINISYCDQDQGELLIGEIQYAQICNLAYLDSYVNQHCSIINVFNLPVINFIMSLKKNKQISEIQVWKNAQRNSRSFYSYIYDQKKEELQKYKDLKELLEKLKYDHPGQEKENYII